MANTKSDEEPTIEKRLELVKEKISQAMASPFRGEGECSLVAVSKTHPKETIQEVLDLGHRVFGENRVQEALSKWPELKETYEGIELHLIGSLQTNKAGQAVELFDVIQTLDRPKLAKALKKEMEKQNKTIKLFIQVNTGEEEQKGGVLPLELEGFVTYCRQDLELEIEGLMCIPPADDEPSLHFALLHKYAKELGINSLSMGMSGDFETAIKIGATHVRVGTSIFGKRPPFKSGG